jgi:tetratricopeptide (TPR) repeat protein
MGNAAEFKKGIARGLAIARTRDLLLQDALLQMNSGKYLAARASVEEVLKQHPEDVGALQDLMLTYAGQKELAAGIQRLKQLVAGLPAKTETQVFLGGWLQKTGQNSEARAAFEAAKRVGAGMETPEFNLAKLDFAEGHYDAAKDRFSNLKRSRLFGIQALLWLGQIEEKRGNLTQAVELYRQAVEKDGTNPTALNNLAYLLADAANRPDEALQYAQQAKELAPGSWEINDTIGWAYYKKAIYPTAVGHFEKAVSQNGSPRLKYHLAMAYLKAGDAERGRKTLQTALRQDASLPEAGMAKELAGLDRSGTSR